MENIQQIYVSSKDVENYQNPLTRSRGAWGTDDGGRLLVGGGARPCVAFAPCRAVCPALKGSRGYFIVAFFKFYVKK